MKKIFVCNGIAVGKTTLINKISNEFSIELKTNFIRGSLPPGTMEFYRRQSILLAKMLELHEMQSSFITDRSSFDILIWTLGKQNTFNLEHVKSLIPPSSIAGSIFVITPIPTKALIRDKIYPHIVSDPVRYLAYKELLGEENVNFKTISELTSSLYENFIETILDYSKDIEFHYFLAPHLPDYYKWQDFAYKYLAMHLENFYGKNADQ